jgi:hypothetical protein
MNNNKNMLIFVDAANTAYMNSADNFRGVNHDTDDKLDVYFQAAEVGTGGGTSQSGYDKIILSVTDEKELEAMQGIAAAVSGRKVPFTVVADDVNSTYCHDNITAVDSITLSATGNYKPVEAITNAAAVTRTLTTNESGRLFTVDMSTVDNNVAITLPTASGASGVMYDFCFTVNSDDDADFSITTGADGTDIYGGIITGGANSTLDDIDGLSKITLDASVAQSVEGCRISLLCDGTNWHISGYLVTAIATVHIVESATA